MKKIPSPNYDEGYFEDQKMVLIRIVFVRWAQVRSVSCDMYWLLKLGFRKSGIWAGGGFILGGGFCIRGKGLMSNRKQNLQVICEKECFHS